MQIQTESQLFSSVSADALIAFVFDEDDRLAGTFGELTRVAKDRLTALVDSGELTGKGLEMVLVHFPEGFTAQRLLLVGAGKRDKFRPASDLRRLAGAAL